MKNTVRKRVKHRRQKKARTGAEKLIKVGKFLAPIVLKGARSGYAIGKKHLTKENARKVKANVSSLIERLKKVKAGLKKKENGKRITMSIIR